MADTLLEVNNIETYYGPIMAIRGVSFTVPRGRIVTILGANGAGKTTILKTVCGVMNSQKGTVAFEGRTIQGMDPDRVMRLGLSHVPEGREVFPFLSVRENLRMGAYTRKDTDGVARDLEMVFEEGEGALYGMLRYNVDLFEADTMDRLLKHFRVILEAVRLSRGISRTIDDGGVNLSQLVREADRSRDSRVRR